MLFWVKTFDRLKTSEREVLKLPIEYANFFEVAQTLKLCEWKILKKISLKIFFRTLKRRVLSSDKQCLSFGLIFEFILKFVKNFVKIREKLAETCENPWTLTLDDHLCRVIETTGHIRRPASVVGRMLGTQRGEVQHGRELGHLTDGDAFQVGRCRFRAALLGK